MFTKEADYPIMTDTRDYCSAINNNNNNNIILVVVMYILHNHLHGKNGAIQTGAGPANE